MIKRSIIVGHCFRIPVECAMYNGKSQRIEKNRRFFFVKNNNNKKARSKETHANTNPVWPTDHVRCVGHTGLVLACVTLLFLFTCFLLLLAGFARSAAITHIQFLEQVFVEYAKAPQHKTSFPEPLTNK